MNSSKFVGQLKQNNEQINSLKDQFFRTEAHMSDYEKQLSETVNKFMEYQNYELKVHIQNAENPHHITKKQVGLGNVDNIQQASKSEFDKHSKDSDIHVTKSKQNKWDAGQLFKLTDSDGSSKTITETNLDDIKMSGMYYISTQHTKNKPANYGQLIVVQRTRGTSPTFVQVFIDTVGEGTTTYVRSLSTEGVWSDWSQIETVTGAQAKVDKHANKTDIHVTKFDKDKWNGGQIAKLTKDDGKRTQLANETDILSLSSGFYYASGTLVKNNPVTNDTSWFNYDVIEGDSGRKSIIAWRSHDNTLWHTTVHTDGVFKGWKRIITSTDFESNVWREPPLKNGWTNYTDSSGDQAQYKVRYTKDTTGTVYVEGAIAKGTIGMEIPAFVLPEGYRPGRVFQWIGVSSQLGMNGIPQYHRLLVDVNGQVIIESCSNTQRPNEYISLGFQFKAE
ncbi:hypothetical protein HUS59_11100 [Bacillus velezensis]|uniref:pyocin knob domain-containing protein n=1 Tax=Bacillus velezensis TaxID=492670 RepID=UPI003219D94E